MTAEYYWSSKGPGAVGRTSVKPTACADCKTGRALYRAMDDTRRLCAPCAKTDAGR